ncbi:thioredoxin [Amycolatopsis benzoatilytica]|uniref:thioredoxin n=1 Tax=Amycolatopsis benzoatilytica TaxID=346045 RepID=UPI000376896C|nr:thioredoxin [Amycolatopsis benzoatilytica]
MTTDATFAAEVLEHDQPVLVDFTADWCPPCRMIAPVLAEVSAERPGLTVRVVNTDENPETMRAYQVMALPTLMLFRDGRPVGSFVGARPKAKLLAELDELLR